MNRTITINGTGKISVKPDLVELTLIIESVDENYNNAMVKAEEKVNEITTMFLNAGFNRQDIKTTNYSVRVKYDSVYVDNIYKETFAGYLSEQWLAVRFDLDKEKLNTVLTGVSTLDAKPKINLRFTVKDKDLIKNKVLEVAAKDSKVKAEILAKASGVKLGKLINIEYGKREIELYSPSTYVNESFSREISMKVSGSSDMVPEDIVTQENVRFTWVLED